MKIILLLLVVICSMTCKSLDFTLSPNTGYQRTLDRTGPAEITITTLHVADIKITYQPLYNYRSGRPIDATHIIFCQNNTICELSVNHPCNSIYTYEIAIITEANNTGTIFFHIGEECSFFESNKDIIIFISVTFGSVFFLLLLTCLLLICVQCSKDHNPETTPLLESV